MLQGTHLYAPPEWLERGEYTGEQATVWSMGVLLYVMVQGDLPFPGVRDIVAGNFKFRKNCSIGKIFFLNFVLANFSIIGLF